MSPQLVFGLSFVFAFAVWTLVAVQYIWPWLRDRTHADALRPLLLLHSTRFLGLVFLVPGVVSPSLPHAFAEPAAYGDLIAAILALATLLSLRAPWSTPLVWAFSIWGAADLIYAFYQGYRAHLEPGDLGAAYFIPTFIVPLLLVTHALVFRLLLRGETVRGHVGRLAGRLASSMRR